MDRSYRHRDSILHPASNPHSLSRSYSRSRSSSPDRRQHGRHHRHGRHHHRHHRHDHDQDHRHRHRGRSSGNGSGNINSNYRHAPSSASAVGLPFKAHEVTKHDMRYYKPLFAMYLDVQKGILLEDLGMEEIKGRWKSFMGKWYAQATRMLSNFRLTFQEPWRTRRRMVRSCHTTKGAGECRRGPGGFHKSRSKTFFT